MTSHHSTDLERAGEGGDPLPDPGLAPHVHRLTDTDPKAARRAERQVASLFGLSALGTVGLIVAYVAIPLGDDLESVRASNLALGLGLTVSLLGIGVGAIHWAKKLMPDTELVHERHPLVGSPEARAEALDAFNLGAEESGFGRRSLIRRSLLGAMALLPLSAVVLLRDLGPLPATRKASTIWRQGVRVVTDVTYNPIRASDLQIGQLVNAMPLNYEDIEDPEAAHVARSKAAVILVRMQPEEITPYEGRENWHIDGILAFSKICTHVGCPISLYEQQTHHLLCPCHQSTFDLANNGRVVFGPAARDLPQLALAVDSDGYLIAQGDFSQPVGPSFWERG